MNKPVQVTISSFDSFTGEPDTFDVKLPEVTGKAVAAAIRKRLADESYTPLVEISEHQCLTWVPSRSNDTEFAFVIQALPTADGGYTVLIAGLVSIVE